MVLSSGEVHPGGGGVLKTAQLHWEKSHRGVFGACIDDSRTISKQNCDRVTLKGLKCAVLTQLVVVGEAEPIDVSVF